MKRRTRIAIGAAGMATAFLLLGTVPPHLPEETPAAPHIRPVCELTQEVGEIPLPGTAGTTAKGVNIGSQSVRSSNGRYPHGRREKADILPWLRMDRR